MMMRQSERWVTLDVPSEPRLPQKTTRSKSAGQTPKEELRDKEYGESRPDARETKTPPEAGAETSLDTQPIFLRCSDLRCDWEILNQVNKLRKDLDHSIVSRISIGDEATRQHSWHPTSCSRPARSPFPTVGSSCVVPDPESGLRSARDPNLN
jgi:hypothetical protein